MRCKNCGADNDDNRYICEVCGSPLYDEDDIEKIEAADNEKTQTFKAINENKGASEQYTSSDYNNYNSYNENDEDEYKYNEPQRKNSNDDEHKSAEKKSIIVIAILAVILIAIIASVVAIAHNKNADKKETTSELTKISSLAGDTDESDGRSHTKNSTTKKVTTTKETTKQTTTETTTQKTIKPTTANLWIINTSSSGGGEAEGDGKYENGKTVTLFARADDGYKFDGWYSNGVKVSDSEEYSFTANENASFSAVFSPVETEPTTTAAPETTASVDTQLPSDTSEINFGE